MGKKHNAKLMHVFFHFKVVFKKKTKIIIHLWLMGKKKHCLVNEVHWEFFLTCQYQWNLLVHINYIIHHPKFYAKISPTTPFFNIIFNLSYSMMSNMLI
jgi:hypothetical protein